MRRATARTGSSCSASTAVGSALLRPLVSRAGSRSLSVPDEVEESGPYAVVVRLGVLRD